MCKPLVSDELWAVVEPRLPPEPPKPKGGRPRMSDRAALSGILFELRSGIGWVLLPQERGCGTGMTCWRRLRDWHQSRVWERLHGTLLKRLEDADKEDWSRVAGFGKCGGQKGGFPRPSGYADVQGKRTPNNSMNLFHPHFAGISAFVNR